MAISNNSLDITSLDFDSIKDNMKTYLSTQSVFRDYDYEGSNINVLMSLLAYNTYLNMFYLNMATNESFLDSAQLRDSVVSKAKELNYTPSSMKSSKAVVDVSFNANGISSSFEIPKGTMFTGTNANGVYTFVTDRNVTVSSSSNTFNVYNLDIYEGSYINETFVVDTTNETQRFILSNPSIDVTSLEINVIENNGANVTTFSSAQSLYGLDSASTVYFLQSQGDKYEVTFGDGVFGRHPLNHATIIATYRISSGSPGNGVETFSIDDDLGAYNGGRASVTITTVTRSSGGAEPESIESIRFRAPRMYQTRGRAIVADDYKTLITSEFPDVKSISVYSGTVDAYFGSVVISPISYAGTALSTTRKNEIRDYISSKMTVGFSPVMVDPEILKLVPSIDVVYDDTATSLSPADIQSALIKAVSQYNDSQLKDFDITYYESELVTQLKNVDPSILSVVIDSWLTKTSTPTLRVSHSVDVVFGNQIVPGTLTSTSFVYEDGQVYQFTDYNPSVDTFTKSLTANGMVLENQSDTLWLKAIDPTKQTYIDIGTIDYEKGRLSINSLKVINYNGNQGITFSTRTNEENVNASDNNIIEIDTNNTSVSARVKKKN